MEDGLYRRVVAVLQELPAVRFREAPPDDVLLLSELKWAALRAAALLRLRCDEEAEEEIGQLALAARQIEQCPNRSSRFSALLDSLRKLDPAAGAW